LPRLEDARLVTGREGFTDDICFRASISVAFFSGQPVCAALYLTQRRDGRRKK
jgi:hypothetical protein